jgi:stage II sporulation protein D
LDLLLEGGGEAVRISASTFRFAMGRGLGWNTVRSDRYAIAAPGGQLTFQGSGAGHGVGLCQRGADQMGIEGHLYHEILSFYYPGALPGLTAQGIPWTRMGGEAVALMTTQPEQDGAVLGLAERLVREASQRTGWLAPGGVEVRVYPDVETFRDATAEPGWVAGRTSGRRIELQPAGVLRSRGVLESTLWHEMLHVFVESQANARLPVWFREGIVEYLAGQRSLTITASNDSAGRARLAYAAAARSVTELVARYGEVAVLSWLAAGLPRDVTNANINHPATNIR